MIDEIKQLSPPFFWVVTLEYETATLSRYVGTNHSMMRHHIPDARRPEVHRCETDYGCKVCHSSPRLVVRYITHV